MILKANIQALLDKAENPAAMAAQMVREIEEAVGEAKQAAVRVAADVRSLEKMGERNTEHAENWARRAHLALHKGHEDLAREAIKHEMQLRKAAQDLAPQIEALRRRSLIMQTDVRALEAKLDEARSRARQIALRQRAAESQRTVQKVQQKLGQGPAISEFDRLEGRVEMMEAEAGSWEELEIDSLEARFRELENESPEIEERLAQMRSTLADDAGESGAEAEPPAEPDTPEPLPSAPGGNDEPPADNAAPTAEPA